MFECLNVRMVWGRTGCSLAQLALAWCLREGSPVSTVIMGASRLSQLEDNLGALSVIPLITAEVQAKVEAVLENQPEPSGTSTMEMVNDRRGAENGTF